MPVAQVLDGCMPRLHIVQAAVAARTASREEIRAHVAPAVLPSTIGNCLLAAGLRFVCLWLGYHLHHDTAKHDYSDVVKESTGKWNGTLLSSVVRVGSICMRVMDIYMYGVDLVSIIFWSAFAHDTQAPPQASWYGRGGISYNSWSHLVLLQSKVNKARYIAQVVNPVLLPYLRQKGDVLFQEDSACPHTAVAMQLALRGVF